jgi:hypothetical protein
MCCLVTAGKHVNDIRAIARQAPITIEKMLEAVFSVGSAPRLYSEDPRPAEWIQLRDIRRTVSTWEREAEESPMLEAVAREQLLETLQAGEDLACSDL